MSKRLFDILFSATCLIALSPLLLAIALLVRCTSPGAVFFKSRRLGRSGVPITCLKFRTMYADAEKRLSELLQRDRNLFAEWNAFQKLKNDPRITPIGNLLRKTSLDELPQFWNVLKGDLSVVGPRPLTLIGPPEQHKLEILKIYGERAANILSVRPGMTGVWQISGRSEVPLLQRTHMEERYALSRTFWTDLVVIAKTIPAIFSSRGAF